MICPKDDIAKIRFLDAVLFRMIIRIRRSIV
jgi:hypothetical protein